MKYETHEIKQTSIDYYTKLFTPTQTDKKKQEKLLKNIRKRITNSQRATLDSLITMEEIEKAVMTLQKGKSPGPDGIPVEFYQHFWFLIKDMFSDFIQVVKLAIFPKKVIHQSPHSSIKKKRETYLLTN